MPDERKVLGPDPVQEVRSLLEENEVSRQELAAKMGKSKQSVSQMLEPGKGMRFGTFYEVADSLGYQIELRKKGEKNGGHGDEPGEEGAGGTDPDGHDEGGSGEAGWGLDS